jgi:cytochrome c oxidase subunit IV
MKRDDIIEYSLDAHHSEEEGVKMRKKIWFVTALLTVITIVEVALGSLIKQSSPSWPIIKVLFIILTLIKAAYIVLSFMHLGHEKKSLKYIVLVPYIFFILYLLVLLLTESVYVAGVWEKHGY